MKIQSTNGRTKSDAKGQKFDRETGDSTSIIRQQEGYGDSGTKVVLEEAEVSLIEEQILEAEGEKDLGTKRTRLISKIKNERSNRKTETGAKRQNLDTETGGSTSTICQQEEYGDSGINDVLEKTEISLIEERILEAKGENDLDTKRTCQMSAMKNETNNEKTEAGGKRQTFDLETVVSTSNIVQQEEYSDSGTNDVTEETEVSLLIEERILQTEDKKDLFTKRTCQRQKCDIETGGSTSKISHKEQHSDYGIYDVTEEVEISLINDKMLESGGKKNLGTKRTCQMSDMKRNRSTVMTESGVKRQKFDMETDCSTSRISQQEQHDDDGTYDVKENTTISLIEENMLESEGKNDLGTKRTCQMSEMKRKRSNEKTKSGAKKQKVELETSGSTSKISQPKKHGGNGTNDIVKETEIPLINEKHLEAEGEKGLGAKRTYQISKVKRIRSNRKTETGAKNQKLNLEASGSASNISQQKEHGDNSTNAFSEETEISLTEGKILEEEGEISLDTKKTYKTSKTFVTSGDNTRPKLEDGLEFDSDNDQYGMHSYELGKRKDQCAKNVGSDNVIIKHGVDVESYSPNVSTTSNIRRDTPARIQMEDEADFSSRIRLEVPKSAIYTRQVEDWILPNAPNKVPTKYDNISPSKLPTEKETTFCFLPLIRQKPDQQTNVLIPHKYAVKPEGDDFGAVLCTYKEQLEHREIYHRHFFEKVKPYQPASEMRIKDNDELVLLNGVFVPALKHTDVLNLFHRVKVDGKTRFSLVIRRKLTKQKWEWVETSAVLAPEKQEDSPGVTDLEYKELEGGKTVYRRMSQHLYKIPCTDKYIDIHDGKVRIGTLNDGNVKTKIIWKHPKFWQADTEGHIDFATTLCDRTRRWFIAIDKKDQIVVDRKPVWFKMIKIGSKMRFQFRKLYLGYDLKSDKLKAQVSDCVFEELPAPSVDTVDAVSSNQISEADHGVVQNNSEQLCGKNPLHINIGASKIGCNSVKSSDVSSPSSADSGISGFDTTPSSNSGADDRERPSFISAQSSATSGYMSSTP